MSKQIIKELLINEIILTNSKDARAVNLNLREKYKDGILEKIYERMENNQV
jgi:hypothetical protein